MQPLHKFLIICLHPILPLFVFLLSFSTLSANNDCANATFIPNVQNFCSAVGQYTLLGATDSGDGTCEIGNRDVWFSFTAQFTDVTITVVGAIAGGPTAGGDLTDPEIVMYSGACTGLTEIRCDADLANDNVVELYKGGLTPGTTYYFKVDSRSTIGNTFQVCINNYNAPQFPDGDCPTATVLCDKSSFNVQSVTGAGTNNQEMQDAFCFHYPNPLPTQTLETNSVWYTWRALTTGTVSFDLVPTNPSDDLDFVVYHIPNGFNPNGGINCVGKTVERCMASGNLPAWTTCFGPTGLDLTSQQHFEYLNCSNDAPTSPTNPTTIVDDNYAKALDQLQGQVYAVAINNFSSTGNGFSISFGGTGLFEGPVADFSLDTSGIACVLDQITVTDLSTYPIGQIVAWEWNFGLDAVPQNAYTQGPHTVSYSTFGPKIISLTITSDRGCKVTKQHTINVDNCIPDFSPVTTILPNVVNGVSALGIVYEVSELNNAPSDGSGVELRAPIDPRLTFTWDPTLTTVALIPVNNADWLYLGNNGFVHIFKYAGPTGRFPALSKSSIGLQAVYDPQFTSGFTTLNGTVYPYSGGEVNVSNNTSSEDLTYFN